MFAGVAASSMPTVHQFFTRQNFSLASKWASLKSSLKYQPNSSTQIKLSEHNPGATRWAESNTRTFEDGEGTRRQDLESNGYGPETVKSPRMGNPDIHLTRNMSSI